jgi:outer membrane protein assembly factor BamB
MTTTPRPKAPTLAAASAALFLLCGASSPLLAQSVYPTKTTIWQRDKATPGETMFASPTGEVILISMAGDVVNRWVSPIAGHGLSLVEPLANGNILCASRIPGQQVQTILELDWSGNAVWSYTLPAGMGFIHHELERLPNGNTLLLCAQTITVPSISSKPLTDDFILEVDPNGSIVWSWFTYEHYDELGFDPQARELIAAQGGDWAHTNAVDPLPVSFHSAPALRPGNLVVSQRYTNTIFIIDKQTGAVVWKVGPANNVTLGQHAPYMIEQDMPGAGNILVFDNGSGTGYPVPGRSPGRSRVVEIEPITNEVVWEYDASKSGLFTRLFYSDIVSNAQRLGNGNTLICSGVRGRLFEVTATGEIVWEYMSPFFSSLGGQAGPLIYRAFRLPSNWGQ